GATKIKAFPTTVLGFPGGSAYTPRVCEEREPRPMSQPGTTPFLLWAKLGDATWPEEFHPVLCHLVDVAAVALRLWDCVFRPRFRGWIAGRLGLDEGDCRRWLAFWAGAHDIGKVAACFQDRNDARTRALKERLCAAGFPFHGWDK